MANVPHTFLAKEKSDQHWMVVEGDKIKFPGGGTHFHDGAEKYIQGLGRMLGSEDGDLSLGGKVRTALDVGCGVASFGGYLLQHNILAMSVAPNDVHQNQIQFALERGIPAWLGVLGTMRLPFPSKSFDLSHCSRCRIDWAQRGKQPWASGQSRLLKCANALLASSWVASCTSSWNVHDCHLAATREGHSYRLRGLCMRYP